MARSRRRSRHRRPERVTPLQLGLVALAVAAISVGAFLLVPRGESSTGGSEWAGNTGVDAPGPASRAAARPSPSPSLPPLPVAPTTVKVDVDGWWGWAMMDMRTGKISGSTTMSQTSTTASMIKSWIAADYLRRTAEQGETPSKARLDEVSIMIRDSDNNAAEDMFKVVGGSTAINRMIDICKLTDSKAIRGYWSNTRMSPRDVTRLGLCIATGKAAGPKWTNWLLNEMRAVRGAGDFGVRLAFPKSEQKSIAIKNGWVTREGEDDNWHVNCLAIGKDWSVGVMMRYPIPLGFEYGTKVCQQVGSQLRAAAQDTAERDAEPTSPPDAPGPEAQ
jgi:hypothetical protein